MKVSTWNVNGIRARESQLFDWLHLERPDVVCLQEIKASPEQLPETLRELPGYWGLWHGGKGYSGVSVHLSRDAFPDAPAFGHPEFDVENRAVVADAGELSIASIYVPNGNKDYLGKVRFLEAMAAWVAERHAAGRRLIVCGDLNVARTERDVHPKLRKPTEIGQTPAEQALLEQILARGLVDLLRGFDPDNDRLFTWWAPWRNLRERNIGWRLDYVLASEPLAAGAVGCRALREFGSSDHGPVVADFAPRAVTRGPSRA
ncbi:MAG TPA: exodeoxyribonuclease III [Haliangiales bacterium]|nr:exodeoxyribonuclease III [Haliangiales bacterium]